MARKCKKKITWSLPPSPLICPTGALSLSSPCPTLAHQDLQARHHLLRNRTSTRAHQRSAHNSISQSLALFIGIVVGAVYVAKSISNTIDETKKSYVHHPSHSFQSLTIPQPQREGGKRQCFRNLLKDKQALDKGRLSRCYSTVGSPQGPTSLIPASLTHLPFTGVWSRPYRQAPHPFQTRALWLIQMGANTIRPR